MKFLPFVLFPLLAILLLSQDLHAQARFSPVWRTTPWDSGGVAPNSAVWSMVASELDLDRDGKKEFLVTSAWSGGYFNGVYLYEASGNNSYQLVWSYSFYPYSNDYSAVAISDLDGNGREEILCLVDPYDSTYHGFYVFEWNGTDNGFPAAPTATWDMNLPGAFDEGTAIIAGDFDNDGRHEVAVSIVERYSLPKSRLMIFSLAAGSTLANPVWRIEFADTTTFAYAGYALASTDLDRNGRKEIVACGWDYVHIALFEHTGTPDAFARAANITQIDTTVDFSNMGFVEANFNNDNTNELYIATATGRVYVMTNPGSVSQITAANFTLLGQYNPLRGITGMTRGDIDRNGVPELYLAGSYHEAVFQWRYLSGSVASPQSYLRSMIFQDDTTDQQTAGSDQGWFRPSKLAVGDFDNDGCPDIIVTSSSFAGDKPLVLVIEQFPTSVASTNGKPEGFVMYQNYPNPFNPATSICFNLPKQSFTTLRVYDTQGRVVASLVERELEAGRHEAVWSPVNTSSGTYFARLTSGEASSVMKMLLVR